MLSLLGGTFSFAGIVIAALAGYILWFRIKEKSLPFNGYSTSKEAMNGMDLSGKTAIVTGSNNGIGKQTVKTMYEHGCNIIMACRNLKKANDARSDIINSTAASTGTIEVMKLDLSSLQSVRDFAAAFMETSKSIDYLILNAGIMAVPEFKTSTEGYELQFAVNHCGHFYLTVLLMDKLIADQSRIIAVASVTHGWCTESEYEHFLVEGIKKKDGPLKKDYEKWVNYGISKCSNILFARELHRRYKDKGIIAVSAHPGVIGATGLNEEVEMDASTRKLVYKYMLTPSWYLNEVKNIDQGAATTLRCVSMTDSEIKGGHYYVNCRSGTDDGWLREAAVVSAYEDYEKESNEARLWNLTETLITQKGFLLKL